MSRKFLPYMLFSPEEFATMTFSEFVARAIERGASPDELAAIATRLLESAESTSKTH